MTMPPKVVIGCHRFCASFDAKPVATIGRAGDSGILELDRKVCVRICCDQEV
jgi:hypothetical protein